MIRTKIFFKDALSNLITLKNEIRFTTKITYYYCKSSVVLWIRIEIHIHYASCIRQHEVMFNPLVTSGIQLEYFILTHVDFYIRCKLSLGARHNGNIL
ncbi:hypothetical protein D3C79_869300 [compost metagenome]